MRLRRKALLHEKAAVYRGIYIIEDPLQNKGKWSKLFGNDHPLHVELGTGKGQFISTLAEQNPHINYIGIEYQKSVIYFAAKKVAAKELKNLLLLRFDIIDITSIFAPGEVDRFYINFCDPWPKRRHARRRLTHQEFLGKYAQILEPGHEIHFKTDNEPLFEFSLNEFSGTGFRMKNISLDLHNSEFQGNILTEYEERFSSRGMKIFRLEAIVPRKLQKHQ